MLVLCVCVLHRKGFVCLLYLGLKDTKDANLEVCCKSFAQKGTLKEMMIGDERRGTLKEDFHFDLHTRGAYLSAMFSAIVCTRQKSLK